jgi:hypothetical protein
LNDVVAGMEAAAAAAERKRENAARRRENLERLVIAGAGRSSRHRSNPDAKRVCYDESLADKALRDAIRGGTTMVSGPGAHGGGRRSNAARYAEDDSDDSDSDDSDDADEVLKERRSPRERGRMGTSHEDQTRRTGRRSDRRPTTGRHPGRTSEAAVDDGPVRGLAVRLHRRELEVLRVRHVLLRRVTTTGGGEGARVGSAKTWTDRRRA